MFGFYHTYDSVARELARGLRSGDILLSGADQTNSNDHNLNRDPETGGGLAFSIKKTLKNMLLALFPPMLGVGAWIILILYPDSRLAYGIMGVMICMPAWLVFMLLSINKFERFEREIQQLHAVSRKLVENGLIVLPESTSTLGVAKWRVEHNGIASYYPFLLHLDLHPTTNGRLSATVWIKAGEEREFDDLNQAVAYVMAQLEHAHALDQVKHKHA